MRPFGPAAILVVDLAEDIVADPAWTYRGPPRDATDVAGLAASFNERVDVVLGGVIQERR